MDKKSHFWQSLARECPRKKNKSRQNWRRRRRRRRRRVLLCGNIRQRELPPNRHCCSSAALLRSQIEQIAASLVPPSPHPPRCLPRRTTSALLLFSFWRSFQCNALSRCRNGNEIDLPICRAKSQRERERENRTFFFAYFYTTHPNKFTNTVSSVLFLSYSSRPITLNQFKSYSSLNRCIWLWWAWISRFFACSLCAACHIDYVQYNIRCWEASNWRLKLLNCFILNGTICWRHGASSQSVAVLKKILQEIMPGISPYLCNSTIC